jgi:hypothetical protein
MGTKRFGEFSAIFNQATKAAARGTPYPPEVGQAFASAEDADVLQAGRIKAVAALRGETAVAPGAPRWSLAGRLAEGGEGPDDAAALAACRLAADKSVLLMPAPEQEAVRYLLQVVAAPAAVWERCVADQLVAITYAVPAGRRACPVADLTAYRLLAEDVGMVLERGRLVYAPGPRFSFLWRVRSVLDVAPGYRGGLAADVVRATDDHRAAVDLHRAVEAAVLGTRPAEDDLPSPAACYAVPADTPVEPDAVGEEAGPALQAMVVRMAEAAAVAKSRDELARFAPPGAAGMPRPLLIDALDVVWETLLGKGLRGQLPFPFLAARLGPSDLARLVQSAFCASALTGSDGVNLYPTDLFRRPQPAPVWVVFTDEFLQPDPPRPAPASFRVWVRPLTHAG